ncbi:MAG: acyl-CoA dehydrogenase family protein [Pseudomonadota bacterium]
MNFDFGENEKAFREKIKGLFDQEARSDLDRMENGDINQIREGLLDWLKRLGKVDYLAFGLDEGANSLALLAAQEMLASISPSLFLGVEVTAGIFGRLVAAYGTPDQKEEILPALKEGLLIGTIALTEGGLIAEPSGGGYRISGSADHVVNAPVADWIAVGGEAGGNGVYVLIKKGSEGLSIGQRLFSLGYNGTATAPISLDNSPVSSKYIIGPFMGREPLEKAGLWEDRVLTAASLGLMQRCYLTALNHAKTQQRGGKPLIADQEFGFKLAEMLTLVQTAQLLAYRAAWMAETGDKEAAILAHCAKVFCAESAEKVASQAIQILGKQGFFHSNPAQEGYRYAKYIQVAGTSTEMSRMKIGEGLLEWK